jgi:hypothetical protein
MPQLACCRALGISRQMKLIAHVNSAVYTAQNAPMFRCESRVREGNCEQNRSGVIANLFDSLLDSYSPLLNSQAHDPPTLQRSGGLQSAILAGRALPQRIGSAIRQKYLRGCSFSECARTVARQRLPLAAHFPRALIGRSRRLLDPR